MIEFGWNECARFKSVPSASAVRLINMVAMCRNVNTKEWTVLFEIDRKNISRVNRHTHSGARRKHLFKHQQKWTFCLWIKGRKENIYWAETRKNGCSSCFALGLHISSIRSRHQNSSTRGIRTSRECTHIITISFCWVVTPGFRTWSIWACPVGYPN